MSIKNAFFGLAIIIILFLGTPFPVSGQDYEYIQYTTKDGLPTNYVYGVVEDEEGYIWAYTENGLSKFDGYTFQNYTTEHGLPGNDISYAEKDPNGKIWLNIHKKGITYLHNDRIQQIQKAENGDLLFQGSFYNHAVYLNKKNNTYFTGSADKNFIYQIKTPKTLTNLLDSFNTTPILEESKIRMWARWPDGYLCSSNDSLMILGQRGFQKTLKVESLLGDDVDPFTRQLGKTNLFLIGNRFGELLLLDFNKGNVRDLNLAQYELSPNAYAFVSVFDSTFIINTDIGFLEFDFEGNLHQKFTFKQLANQYSLLRVFRDSRGNLWIGSRQGGLFFVPRQFLTSNLISSQYEDKNSFEQFYALENGELLCVTDHAGIYLYQNNQLKQLSPSTKRRFRSIQNTSIGLFIYDGINGRVLKKENNYWKSTSIQRTFENAWIWTNGKLEKYNGSGREHYAGRRNLLFLPKENYFFEGAFRWIDIIQLKNNGQHIINRITHDNNFLFYHREQDLVLSGNNHGLFICQEDRLIPFLNQFEELKNINIIEGNGDNLWISTENNGIYLYQFNHEQLTKLYPSPVNRSIKQDTDSTLILATNTGIKVIHKFRSDTLPVSEYTVLDGLPSNDIRDVHPIGDSILLVATFEGVHKIDRRLKNAVPLDLQALKTEAFKVNNITYPLDTLPIFRHQENNIDLSFHLQDYASNGQISYHSQLAPIEKEWRTSAERSVSYLSLPPGKYTFHLKAENAFGQEVLHDPISFQIKAPFWERIWFLILSGLLLLISIIALINYRDRIQRSKLAKEKRLNQKLTKLELTALKAQMNPHFVFNALGSIQYFIQTQDVELADGYLAKFAKLMRMYLDSSKEKMIPLEQEMKLLHTYTDLEKMRFEDHFKVHIDKAPEVDENDCYLPSMMIQPLIENAINHGLENRRDGKGLLEVIFKKEQQHLVCLIKDNGIGRVNAAKLRNKSHRSRGLALIKEKIQTLQNSGIAKINMQIGDLYPHDLKFPGTEVKLVIENFEDDEG